VDSVTRRHERCAAIDALAVRMGGEPDALVFGVYLKEEGDGAN